MNAFSHYLLGQYDASLSWAREALYVNPNHLQMLALRTAALAQSGRAEEAAKAAQTLLSAFPEFTVERHLRNFRWKLPEDTAHYRDGLLKAGVPLGGSASGLQAVSSNIRALRPANGTRPS
jgi:tetratricopeptide (TPR) repeat protein